MHLNKGLLLSFIALLLALSVALVLPFLQYFLLAVLLAYLLWPLQQRLTSHTGSGVAALALVAAATVTLILPLAVVARAIAADAASLFGAVRDGEITFEVFEAPLRRFTGVDVDLAAAVRSAIGDGGTEAFGSVLGLFEMVTHAFIGFGLTLFLLYYLLKDGGRLMAWLRWTVPLPDHVQDDLYDEMDAIAGGVLAGHVLVAVVQGVIAGVGLAVAGIPNALFWTAVMVVLALLPIVGSFLVWGPAALYLLVVGRPIAAALLFLYGAIIVGVSDDYLRPVVVDRYAKVNPGVIIIGVLGGIYVIGFMGIFFGPIVIGILRPALEVYREEYVTASS